MRKQQKKMFNINKIVDVKIQRLPHCVEQLPEYKTVGAAAMDLYAAESKFIHTGTVAIIKTGIALALPEGFEAQIRCRSGLAAKGLFVMNGPGTIDSDYRGEICVILGNFANYQDFAGEDEMMSRADYLLKVGFKINRGDRIAQMLFAPVYRGVFTEVNFLDATARADGGFGSTGK
jgi:dUTP pyrophosphatase